MRSFCLPDQFQEPLSAGWFWFCHRCRSRHADHCRCRLWADTPLPKVPPSQSSPPRLQRLPSQRSHCWKPGPRGGIFFWYLVFAWLLIPWLIAWFERRQTLVRVYADRVSLERGLLKKCYREFFISDVRSIDIDQVILAKLVGIGNLTFSTAASMDGTECIEGIPNPQRVRDLVVAHRQGV